jgi:multisubunit Na+/H+ antiporter MnhC subunit
VHTMRKLFALALMALALASFAAGCGKKAEETPPAATESTMMADSTAMGGADSTSMMSADSTKH